MDFSTCEFWLALLPAVLLFLVGHALLRHRPEGRRRFNKGLMLVTSLTLLGLASTVTLGIFLTVSVVAYLVCLWARRLECGRKVVLGVLIALLLLPLLYYKYGYFICSNVRPDGQWDTLRDLVIPIGISFYTFQVIGFCIDTLIRRLSVPGFWDYMNFCSFFPQIVAGPIERRDDLLPQVQEMSLPCNPDNVSVGLRYIILGLFFKCCVADNLASGFLGRGDVYFHHALLVWINNLVFTFRIYFDFAGYGLTAYGLGRAMGISLRMNFLSPYTATNVTDFWRRWHTSLTLWFRDYIYFPMGGSRTKRWALNIFVVFLVSGLWHGANWNFLIWGGLIAVTMVVYRLYRRTGWHLPAPLGWMLTFACMVFIWMFFYEEDLSVLGTRLEMICQPEAYDLERFLSFLKHKHFQAVFVMVPPSLLMSAVIIVLEAISYKRCGDPYALLINPYACCAMVFTMVVFASNVVNPFIYFAF